MRRTLALHPARTMSAHPWPRATSWHALARCAADPGHPAAGPHDVRRQGPGHELPADRAAAAAQGRAQRPAGPDRRRRLRRVAARSAARAATPNFERLAGTGLKYTRFHTTALCSPTRTALLTGRNHHSVGMGNITELATSAPGNNSIWPNTAAPLARILNLNGYSTAQFGKCHEVPVWETSPMGPYRQWPTGMGFDYFYGFLGGETNQWYPALYEGTTPVEPWGTPEDGYYFNDDLSSHAIKWMRQQKALMPDRPFFAYYAPGATHAPHHVPKDWADNYAGAFDDGWDALREETFARQKELGVIPPDAELTERSPGIPAWDDVADEMKPILARQMEVYAGFLENTDHHIGELLRRARGHEDPRRDADHHDHRRQRRVGRGLAAGHVQRDDHARRVRARWRRRSSCASKIDELGGPEAYNHYAVGWAHAMDTPYQWTKQVASHFGGTRNGTIVHWPAGIEASGEIARPVPPRDRRRADDPRGGRAAAADVRQRRPAEADRGRLDGLLVRRRGAAERHETQYFEMFGNRGIYHKGWTAVTKHRTPWETGARGQDAGVRRRRLGALRHDDRLDAGARPRRRAPGQAARAAAAVADRGGQVQRRAARRPLRRARPARDGRPPDARAGQAPAAVRRHGPPDREPRADDEEHVVLADRAAQGARGRAPRA